ncbi:hypothetical protein KAS50_08090 [bacterium]|nr:hypothetical protein [bacterium]
MLIVKESAAKTFLYRHLIKPLTRNSTARSCAAILRQRMGAPRAACLWYDERGEQVLSGEFLLFFARHYKRI